MGRTTWNARNWTLVRRCSASGSSSACKLLPRMESEGHMELSEYNGWENRFTWLMHLHLSSEQVLMQEVAALMATTSSNRGKLLATWVKAKIFNWRCSQP